MHINYRIQTHEYNTLAITQEVLYELNAMAIERNYNRTLKRGFFPQNLEGDIPKGEECDRVVITGIPIQVEMAMPHYHAQGRLVMPHVRGVFKVPTITMEEYVEGFGLKTKDVNLAGFDTLEWVTISPPPHGNFETIPTVYHGPYDYSLPEIEEDWLPQNQPIEESLLSTLKGKV